MAEDIELLRELARVKVEFQLRALTTAMGLPTASSTPARAELWGEGGRAFHSSPLSQGAQREHD